MVWSLMPDFLECEVKWSLGSITTNKASGGDRIPAKLFLILKDAAAKVLHSICQQIWRFQQWSQDQKRSVFIPVLKKDSAKECSNYWTVALISHAIKLCSKSFKLDFSGTWTENFQMNKLGLGKTGTRDQIASILWIIEKGIPEKLLLLVHRLC